MARHQDKTKAPRVKYVKLADLQRDFSLAHKWQKPADPDLFTFTPAVVQDNKGSFLIWRSADEYERSDRRLATQVERLTGKKARLPRPVRIPKAIVRFVTVRGEQAIQVPLNFAINIGLARDWMRYAG